MRRVRGLSNATKRLRGFGLAVIAMVASAGLALVAFSGAQSAADGADSEVDYYLELNIGATNNQYASHPETGLLGGQTSVTWEAWIYPVDGTLNREAIFSKEANFAVGLQGGQLFAAFSDSNGNNEITTLTGVKPPINAWSHVAFVKSGTSVLIYLNGSEVINRSNGAYATVRSTARELRIGNRENGERFKGRIDEVRIWEAMARTQTQIQWGMHKKINPLTDLNASERSALVGYWDFNEPDSSTTVYARHTTYVRNLTLVNGPVRKDVKQVSAASDGDTVITFPRTYLPGVGGWTVPENATDFRALVVAGGGGGGGDEGGGGGAGGLTESAIVPASGSILNAVVGMGGFGAKNDVLAASNGQNSEFGNLGTLGGGAGGDASNDGVPTRNGANGGSGGGRAGEGSGGTAGTGVPDQGNNGAATSTTIGNGGGGAGAAASGINGGSGKAVSIITATLASALGIGEVSGGSVYFAGGGGGGKGNLTSGSPGSGGLGGGSDGNGLSGTTPEAIPNTGGGGGGGGEVAGGTWNIGFSGKSGGSGVVIVRYTPSKDLAWNKNGTAQSYAFTTSNVIPASGSWTYEAWYYFDSTDVSSDFHGIFAQMANVDTVTDRVSLWLNTGYLHYSVGGSGSGSVYGYKFSENRWYHLAMVRNVNDLEIFVDGTQIVDVAQTWGTIGSYFSIGGTRQTGYPELSGAIDQVKVWSTALGASALQTSMHTYSSSGITGTLKAHYDFNEFEDGIVRDRSGNNHHLVFNTAVSGGYASTDFEDSLILDSGTAHVEQSYVKFKRSYLTANGGWLPPSGISKYKALVVAGGGGGGAMVGGGGGAGGHTISPQLTNNSTVIPIKVGQGGVGAYLNAFTDLYDRDGVRRIGSSGQDSSFGTLTTTGGGRGSNHDAGTSKLTYDQAKPLSGGSGGGGGGYADNTVVKSGAAGTPGQGTSGGTASGGDWAASGGGGAGQAGSGGSASSAGAGGNGLTTSLTGTLVTLAGGGGGGDHAPVAGQGVGGSGGGGAGALLVGSFGQANTGGGGGGAGGNWTDDSYGGSGGSGVVILSWGPYLEVTQSPTVARAGDVFRNAIRLQARDEVTGQPFLVTYSVSVTASSNVLTLNGVLLTQSYTVQSSAVDGTVDFSGLGFASNVGGDVTLTFTSDQFVGTSLVLTPTYFPQSVNITSTGTTGGSFHEGEFYASVSNAAVTIRASDLNAHLASYSTTISTSGAISVQASVSGTAGSLELRGASVAFTNFAHITLSSASAKLVLRATGNISTQDGSGSGANKFTTNNGDIVLWSDSDSNGAGSIYVGSSVTLDSANGRTGDALTGGGRITLAGSQGNTGVDADGHPLGSAADDGGYALVLQAGSLLNSGGGKVTIRAYSDSANDTFHNNNGSLIDSGTGQIFISVSHLTRAAYVNQGATLESASTVSPAIEISSRNFGTGNSGMSMANTPRFVSTGQVEVGISISATIGAATSTGISAARPFDLLSAHGDIAITTNGQFNLSSANARAIGAKASSEVISSSADVRITAQAFLDSTGNTLSKISTSGGVEILPTSGSFNADSHLHFEVEASSFTYGNEDVTNATKNIILYKDVTTSGAITISAATITIVNGVDLVTTGDESRITMKSKDWIDIRSGTNATSHSRLHTNNGDIILWADADGNGTGGIYLGTHNELNSANGVKSKTQSGGGRITIAGSHGNLSVDADGHPLGALAGTIQEDGVARNYALFMNTGAEIYSGGGDVTIRSRNTFTNEAAAYINGTALIWSGTGVISASVSHHASGYGLALENGSWVSAATASPAIEVNTSTAGAGNYFAFYSNNSTTPFTFASLANSGGGISVSARTAASTYQAIRLYGADLLSGAGAISITTNGYAVWNTTVQRNLGAKSGSDVTSSAADVQIVSNGVYDTAGNSASRISTSGAVSFKPSGSTYGIDYSIQFEIEAGSFDFGKIENVNSAATDVTFLSDVTTQGGITVSARSIVVTAGDDLVTTENQQSIFLKAKSHISSGNGSGTSDAGHSRIQTNNGDIILWANSDGDATGGITLGNYFQLNSANGSTSSSALSGGGDVILGGGTTGDSRGYPTGFAAADGTYTDRSIHIQELTGIYSGGGDISIRGKSASSFGVVVYRGLEIFSGTGKIDIEGQTTGTGAHYGFAFVDTLFEGQNAGPLTVVSGSTQSPAVRISGTTAGTGQGLRLLGANASNVIQVVSSAATGGGIELSGRAASAAYADVYVFRAQVLSRAGSITISGGVNVSSFDYSGLGNNVFGSSPSSNFVTTSSASLALISDEWDFDGAEHQFNLLGDVTVLPFTNNYFSSAVTFGFATDKIRNLTIGKPPTVGDSSPTITITGTHSVSGAIRIYGGTLNLAGTSNYLRAAGTISMVANGDIDVQENITTFGGPIVLWSNADGTTSSTGGGRIDLDAAATLTSNGGDVVFGGGTSANYLGYPTGNAKSQDASALASIDLYGDIDSSGGDVIMRAEGPSGAGSGSIGTLMMRVGSQISSGAGDISISGRVPSDTTNLNNQWGLWFGTSTTTNQPTITSTTGDISLLGDATAYISNARNNRPGIVLYSGLIQSGTGDISIEGRAAQHSTGDFVDVTGWDAGGFTISSSGNVTIAGRAGGAINLRRVTVTNAETLTILTDSLTAAEAASVKANRLVIDHAPGSSNGTAVLETPANLTIQASTGDLVMGSSGVGRVLVSKAVSISGNVQVQATNVSLSANVLAGGNSPTITISADVFDISASVKATGGNLALLANTAGRGIMLGGTTTSALLQVSDSELDQLFATNLRIGDSSTADIFIAGDISISSSRVTNLLLRSAGDVIASPGAEITAQNLAIEAGGIIDLIGDNAVSGNVALSASSGVSYSSAVSYSPAAVAEFVPVFGIGVAVSQTNSPTVAQANEFLAVTFNPPPQFVVTDSYSNTLDQNNRLAASYTVSATVTQGTGTVTGRTASFSAGVYSFNSLRVDTNPGTYSFTINVDDGSSGFSTSSAEYNVQSGDPQQLIVTATDSTAPSGQASFSYAVSVQDQGGNPIVAGSNANITVSASVSGGVLVSGGQVQTDNSGVATFNDLVITASVSSQISISFFVEFTNNSNVLTTVSSSVTSVTLTPGTATQLRINDVSQSVANRSTLSALVIDLLDAQGNIVFDRTDEISMSIGSGSGASISGTAALSFSSGGSSLAQVTFSNLALQGTVGSFRLDFESNQAGIASVSHNVTLTNGAAAELVITQGAAQLRSGIQVVTQPRLALRDLDGNLVPSEASVSATVQGATLSGTTALEMVDGLATFSDLVLTGTAGNYTISYAISNPVGLSGVSTSEVVSLTAGAATKLRVGQQPGDVVAGVGQAVSVSVQVLDAQDNLTTVSSNTTINLSLFLSGSVIQTTSPVVLSAGQSTLTYSNLVLTKAGTNLKLLFTASSLADVYSDPFTISAAAPHHLEWVTNVADVANDVAMSPAPTLRVLDEFDNYVVASSAQTSISVSVIVGGVNVLDLSGGTSQTDSSSSLVSLDNLVLRAKVGSYQLRITAINSGQPIDGFTIDSDNFDVDFGAAVSLETDPVAMSVVNRVALNDITVSVLDSAGNLVSNDTSTVTPAVTGLALTGSPVSAVGGVATFSGLVVSGVVGSYDLGFSATGLTSATTSIAVTHGAAASVELTVSAAANNGALLETQPVLRILDADGNLVESGNESDQTVELVVSPGTLSGTTAISASAGIATFSGIALVGEIGSNTLTGRIYSPQTFASNQVISLGFGAATKLTLETSAAGAASGISLTTQPTLRLRDSSDNIVTGVAHDVVATINPAASLSGTTVAVDTATGLATFTSLSISGTVASYSISFAISGASSSDVASVSQDITLGHGLATGLRVVSGPTSGVAGATLSPIVIEVVDHRGNRVTSGPTSSKTISITNARLGPVLGTLAVSLNNGVATFDDVAITQADTVQRLSFNVAGFTAGSTANFPLAAAAPSKLGFTSYPLVDRIAGQAQANDSYVRVLDEFGNYATTTTTVSVAIQIVRSSDTSSVSRTLGFFTIPANDGGVTIGKSNLFVQQAGNFQIRASASNLVVGFSNTFTVSNAAPYAIVFVQSPPASVSSGISISPVVEMELRDPYSNPVLNSTVSITVTSTSGGVTSIVGGVAQNTLGNPRILFPNLAVFGTQGSAQLRFSGTLPQGSLGVSFQNANIQITAGNPYQLSVSPTSLNVVNRGSFPEVAVKILDLNGNLVSSSALVSATLSGATLSGVLNVSAEGGVATFSALGLSGEAGNYTLTFESQDLVDATSAITLGHGIAHSIDLTVPGSAKVSQTTSDIVVKIYDQDNNLVDSGDQSSQTVQLSIADAVFSGTTAVSASAGIATFSNVAITGSVSNKVITATIADPSEITASETVSLSFGVAAKLAITTPAAGFVNRTNFTTQPSVTVQDISGNTVEDYSGSVTLNIGSGASFNYAEPANVGAARLASCTPSVSGGLQYTVALAGSDCVISFTSGSGSWTPSFDGSVQLLAVAGGGGGGAGRGVDSYPGGGGGAGELLFSSSRNVSQAAISIQIGQGGANAVGDFENGGTGGNTTFGTTTLRGGGFGSGANGGSGAGSGGSGGGGNGFKIKTGGSSIATVGLGFGGGSGGGGAAGGGGGAGGVGLGPSGQQGGAGGPGLEFDISGQLVTYAAGGKGGSHNLAGQGRPTSNSSIGGGGGGRAGYNSESTAGQPGIVIVRFPSSVPAAVNVNLQGGVSVTPVNGVATFTNLGLRGTVGDYTITASATSLVSASQDVTLTHGVATQLELTGPATVINDTNFSTQPSLRLLDADGNLVSTSASASGQVVVSYTGNDWTTDGTGVDLSGTTTLTLSQGQGSFSDLRLSGKVGSYTLTYSYQLDTSISTSGAVTVEPGTESSIAIVQQPQNVIAGVAFASDVVVEILDAYQNRVTRLTESATVRAKLINSSGSALVTYSTAVGAQQGLVTFSALTFTSAGDRKIVFESAPDSSASALASVTSAQFTITHAAASSLSWVVLPQGSVANDATLTGVGGSPQIRAFDEFGNLANTGTVSIEVVSVGSNNPQAINGGEVDGVNGTITFTQLSIRALVGLYDLEFRATTDTNPSVFATLSHQVQVLHGVPTQVTTSAHATAARAGINLTPQPQIRILDSAGNLVSNSALVVYAVAEGATLVGASELAATNGVTTFSGLQLTGSASSAVTLSYEISYQSSSISTSVVIPLLAGDSATASLSWSVTDVQTRVAPQNDPVVELFDSFGNKVLSDVTSTAVARLYKGGTLVTESPAVFTASSGEITFNGLALKATPGINYRYEFEVAGLAPVTSSNFVMLPGPVTQVVIHQQPRTIVEGITTTMTGEVFNRVAIVHLLDQDNNIVTTVDGGDITAAISTGTGGTLVSSSASISNGVATFTNLRLEGVVATPEQAAEDYRLTFGYNGFSSAESDVLRVKHNITTKLTVETPAASGRSGVLFGQSPVIKLRDRYDNWVSTGEALSIDVELVGAGSGAGIAELNEPVDTVNGIATLSMKITGPVEFNYTLRFFTDGNNSDVPYLFVDQTDVTITHGNHSAVRILRNVGSEDGNGELTMIGEAFHVQPVIEVIDSAGNRVLDYNLQIVASISAQVRGERDFLIGHTASAVAGVATFSNLAMVAQVLTDYDIYFNRINRSSGQAVSESVQVVHGLAEYLTIETQPEGGNKTGSALSQSPIIAVRDFDGNITTTLNGSSVSAAIFSGGGSVDVSGTNTDKALVENGIAAFSNLTVVALPGDDQTLEFTLDGASNSVSGAVTSSPSATFSLIVADAFQLSVFTQPCTAADCTAGPTAGLLGVPPVVEVQDRFGNRVPGFTGLVTATLQGAAGFLRDANDRISSRSVEVVNGLAEFNDLRIEGAPGTNYSLLFATQGLESTTSQDVQVIHTTPSQLVITQQPIGGVTGDELAGQPVVELRDQFGNLAVTDNSTLVSVSVFSGALRENGDAAEITGSLTVTVAGGVATFSGLEFFAKTNENYVLRFATSGFGVNSNNVVVTPASANRLEWVRAPIAQRTGEVMGTQPVLRMLDFDGNLASSTSATIGASVTGGGGYIEAGTTSASVDGVITFSGLTLVATPNVAQTLSFTATTANGDVFSINAPNQLTVQHTDASQMLIDSSYATSAEQGLVLGAQPVIKLYDRFMNPTVNDSSTAVTATIGSGVGGAVSGSATATAVAGVVSFAGLAVTGSPGVAYTLDFSAGGYGVAGTAELRLFKTAALEVSYSHIVFSSSPTTSPAIAFTDSTEHSISFSVSTPQFCTINASSGEVTIVGAGTCVIQTSVADGTYYKATSKDVTLTIQKAQQDPVVITNNNYVYFGEVLTLTSTGGSSTGTTTFFANGECKILGDKLMTFGNANEGSTASCTILASRPGDSNYLSSATEWMEIEVRRIAQPAITIGNTRNVSVGSVNLFILGGSGTGALSFSVSAVTNVAQCSIVDGALSAARNGTCEVSAQKAMSANFNTASSPVAIFNFSKQLQQVSITSAPPAMPLPGQSYQVAATASSGLSISFSVTKGQEIQETQFVSYSAPVCALSQSVSGQVLFLRSGECEVTATAASDDRFASGTAKISILVGQLNQFITFNPISDRVFGSPSFRLDAVASSGLPVSFTVSAGVSVCSLEDGRITIEAAGTCEITARQGGNGTYAPAPNVVRSFVVAPDVASAPSLVSAAVGNQWFTVGYTAPSYTGGADIIGYRLEVSDQNDNIYLNSSCPITAPLTCTVIGIPNDMPYSARIAAITAAGIGQFSNTSGMLTPSRAAMSVTQLSADVSSTGLDMSWITPAAVEGNFLRYEVYAWVTDTTEPTSPTATITDSTSDEVSIAVSSISNVASVSPASFVAPRLEIVQPLFRPNGGVHIFGAARTAPIGFFALASIAQPNTASATVGYTLRVVTITDVASSSQVINTANGVKIGLSTPSAPTQFNLDTSDPTKLTVTWAAPNSDGGFPLMDYQVKSNGQVICANIQVRMCEISPLTESTAYNIEVQARNALGYGTAAAGSHTTPTPEPEITLQSQDQLQRITLGAIPRMVSFMPNIVRPGAIVSVTGERLDTLYTLSLGSTEVQFLVQDSGALRFKVPVDMPNGRYSVIHTSSFGQVTVMDAITVLGTAVEEEFEPPVPAEPDSPLNPEANPPTDSSGPQNGSQGSTGDQGSGGASGSDTDSGSGVDGGSVDSNEPTPSEPTAGPKPSETQGPADPREPDDEVVVATGPRDQAPVMEFSLSLALILLMLLVLFALRLRRERN